MSLIINSSDTEYKALDDGYMYLSVNVSDMEYKDWIGSGI